MRSDRLKKANPNRKMRSPRPPQEKTYKYAEDPNNVGYPKDLLLETRKRAVQKYLNNVAPTGRRKALRNQGMVLDDLYKPVDPNQPEEESE